MSICVIIPVADMHDANASLEAQGFGPQSFRVPAYESGMPTYAVCHTWSTGALVDALKALPNAVWDEGAGDPVERAKALARSQGAEWPEDIETLPDEGVVMPGEIYDYAAGQWQVIQQFDRGVYGGNPEQYPALIQQMRVPGKVGPWKQPTAEMPYKVANPFTGEPDRVTHGASVWVCTDGDANGNNVWEPGVFGWTVEQAQGRGKGPNS